MGDWAKNKLSELSQQENGAAEAGRAHTLDRQHTLTEAPHLWRETRKYLEDEIGEISYSRPDYLTFRDVPAKGKINFVVIGSPQWEVEITFDPDSPRIVYQRRETPSPTARVGVESEGSFVFVHQGPHVGLQRKNDKPVVGPPFVAAYLLDLIA